MRIPLDMAAATHPGRVRLHNEDSIAASPQFGLAVLADGMGGHNAGEVASRMAVEIITSGIESALERRTAEPLDAKSAESLIAQHIAHANARIFDAGLTCSEFADMGTTLVVALWHNSSVSVGHIGDSRMYRLRARKLKQLTHDHSLVQEQVDRGMLSVDEARTASIRNILTRTVGNARDVAAELDTFRVAANDLFLVCSDGLTDMLTDEQIQEALISFGAQIQQAADELIQRANSNGGVDNVSVILVRLTSDRRQGLPQ